MKWLSVVILALNLFLNACGHPSNEQKEPDKPRVEPGEIGSQLPAFEAVDIHGGKLSFADFKNKVTLIDFWATWCAPCRKEMPGYQMLFERYGDRGFAVVGFKVDMMSDSEDPLRFIKEVGVKYPIAIGSEEIRNQFGGIQGLPTTLIYDRKGILRNKIIGFEYTTTVEKIVSTLL